MGSGGGDVTSNNPWAGQSPYLSDVFNQSQQLYYSGGPQHFGNSSVVPFSPQTQQSFDMRTQRALQGSAPEHAMNQHLAGSLQQQQFNLGGAGSAANQAAGGVGVGQQFLGAANANPFLDANNAQQFASSGSAPYQHAVAGMTGFGGLGDAQQFAGQPATGSLDASNQYVSDFLNDPSGMASGAGAQQLSDTASGAFLGSNPYLDQMYDHAAGKATDSFNENVVPGINNSFGAAGRTGGGAHALATGRAAGELSDSLAGMAGDIYAPAYESERGRQVQAAGQMGQLGLQGASVGGSLFGTGEQAGIGRQQLASQLYLGDRGLGQQAALGGWQNQLSGNQLGGQLYGQGMQNLTQAGAQLGQLGLGGVQGMGDLYGNIANDQFRSASLVPGASQLDYNNINQLAGVGGEIEAQAGRHLTDQMNRFNYYQNAPYNNLNNYSTMINQLPAGLGQTIGPDPSGNQAAGALGGAMSGAQMGTSIGGPGWGTALGAIGGGILGYMG